MRALPDLELRQLEGLLHHWAALAKLEFDRRRAD